MKKTKLIEIIKKVINEEANTARKLINRAERDGYILYQEMDAPYIMSAAKKIGQEWDGLPPEKQIDNITRDEFLRRFLKIIHHTEPKYLK